MHAHNVLHRDLKTANIFLTKEGLVKIGDFGISKMLTTRQGGANTVLGNLYNLIQKQCCPLHFNRHKVKYIDSNYIGYRYSLLH